MQKPQVSLVLSGGGARGTAHIGVIEELTSLGYVIHSIVGTSMGAFVGGAYAMGKLDEFKKWLLSVDTLSALRYLDFSFREPGLIKGDRIMQKFSEIVSDVAIEDMPLAYTAVATDILNYEEVLMNTGSLHSAIRASIAIPTVFTPLKHNNRLLIDGGVQNNVPVNHAIRRSGDILVVVNVNSLTPVVHLPVNTHEEKSIHSQYLQNVLDFRISLKNKLIRTHKHSIGYFKLINRTIGLMTNQIAQLKLEKFNPDILVEISRESCSIFDFFKTADMVKIGRIATTKHIAEYEAKM